METPRCPYYGTAAQDHDFGRIHGPPCKLRLGGVGGGNLQLKRKICGAKHSPLANVGGAAQPQRPAGAQSPATHPAAAGLPISDLWLQTGRFTPGSGLAVGVSSTAHTTCFSLVSNPRGNAHNTAAHCPANQNYAWHQPAWGICSAPGTKLGWIPFQATREFMARNTHAIWPMAVHRG